MLSSLESLRLRDLQISSVPSHIGNERDTEPFDYGQAKRAKSIHNVSLLDLIICVNFFLATTATTLIFSTIPGTGDFCNGQSIK